jgi:hypothetical protein
MVKYTSPQNVNKFIDKILDKINAKFDQEIVPVVIDPNASLLNCFINVAEKVRRDGGHIHYGWAVWQSDLICEAERHAVWEDLEGNLIDITPKENFQSDSIMFISDNNFVYTGQLTDNVRLNITNNSIVDDFITLCETVEPLYSYGTRIDSLNIEMHPATIDIIRMYESLQPKYLEYIRSGGIPDNTCFCGSPKHYKNCHGKPFLKKNKENVLLIKKEINNENRNRRNI